VSRRFEATFSLSCLISRFSGTGGGAWPQNPSQAVDGETGIPECWEEFTPQELAWALAESRWAAGGLLDLSCDLAAKLPGTMAAFRSGTLRQRNVAIIAGATALLGPAEARVAEALVLGRAAKLTPGGLRAAIARAVMAVAPDKATAACPG
jgi:hypothetical protein